MALQYYCEKCGRMMDENQFYTSKNLEKYPDGGKLHQCKKCLTMHVDNWNPETYKPILKEIDVPYIKGEWDGLLEKYGKDPTKLSGMTILGRYLSKMKLRQWAEYGWEDTERLEEEDRAKKTRALQAAGYSGEEIEEKLAQDFTPDRPGIVVLTPPGEDGTPVPTTLYEEPDTVMDELTDEDKMYLRLKWGKGYRADEWVRMEQLYEDMLASYDIQGAGHKDTLVMICKLSLKVNQLLDIGDIDGAMKAEKMYDNLMKSGKFTAAQNKGETGEFIDSIGELVSICEKEGFIPRYYTDGPQDKIDETLEDFKRYTHTLVTEELNLGDMIESSLKQIVRDREEEAKITTEDGSSEDENLSEIEYELRDSDFEAFYEAERERAEATQLLEEEG